MATQSWSSQLRHDSDAAYVAWRDEFISYLNTFSGLTAVATNITVGAGTRPGVNTEQGYAVYYLNDSLHGTHPIYLRFGFGTNSSAGCPRLRVQVGTAHSGGGTLTGGTPEYDTYPNTATAHNSTAGRQSYMCCNEGFFGFIFKYGAPSTGYFIIFRECDEDGAPVGTGLSVYYGANSVSNFLWRWSSSHDGSSMSIRASGTTAVTAPWGLAPCGLASSNPGSVLAGIQIFTGFIATPRVSPTFAVCGVLTDELSAFTTFSATMVGAAERTYLLGPAQMGPFGSITATSLGGLSIAMLWE